MTKIRIGRRVKGKGATGFMLIVAGVLVAARMEAGNQRQGEKHTRKLRLTGNGPQAHIGEAEPRTTRNKKGKTMRGKQSMESEYYGGVSKRSQPRKNKKTEKGREKRTAGNQRQMRGRIGKKTREKLREAESRA